MLFFLPIKRLFMKTKTSTIGFTLFKILFRCLSLAFFFAASSVLHAQDSSTGGLTFDPNDPSLQTHPDIVVNDCFGGVFLHLNFKTNPALPADVAATRFSVRWFVNGYFVSKDLRTPCFEKRGFVIVYIRDFWTHKMYYASIDLG